jgi:hypothetical protein
VLSSAVFDNVSLPPAGYPTIVQNAAAWPEVVEGDHANLSVMADDGDGDAGLRYTWSVLQAPAGAPAPLLGDNGTHDARDTTATFFRAGTYLFRVTASDFGGHSTSQAISVEVRQTLSSVTLSPPGALLQAGSTAQFAAHPLDQFGRPYLGVAGTQPSAPGITWEAYYGAITEDGVYTAPADWSGREVITAHVGDRPTLAEVYVYDPAAGPTLLSAESRKVHGRRGAAGLPLALFGEATIEPRRGGPTTFRFLFDKPVNALDGSLDANDFQIDDATFRSAQVAGSVLTLELDDVLDRSLITVSLTGFAGLDGSTVQGQTTVRARALYGDANGDGIVNAIDLGVLRSRVSRPPTGAGLLFDLDLDGVVTATDLLLVRRRAGNTVA